MIPSDIGAHPDAPDHYIRMGKPDDWDDADCGSLAVRRVATTGDILFEPAVRIVRSDLPSGESLYPAFMSEWVPSIEELALLNAGQPIRMLVSGNGLPPVALWVRSGDEV
jgi:hypothetical protein